MKTISKILSLVVIATAMGACSNEALDEIEQPIQEESKLHTCKMELIGGVTGFDQPTTRATSSNWTDGDQIFIAFYNGSTVVPGEATYSTSGGWTLNYDGDLATGTDQKCEARFFVNATLATTYLVTINPNTEIYEDVNAKYTYNNGTLTVQASLVPKTGRMKFTGKSGDKINLTGITTYSTFAPSINQFTTSKAMITETVASTGSTAYVYGSFSNTDKNICIIGSDFAFTRTCTGEMLKVGESGYMAIPSAASHNNWRTGAYISIYTDKGTQELKMIPVAGHEGGFFLIAETETTEQLWNTVNGTASTSAKPIVNVTYSSILSFIEKINNATKLKFKLPSKAQWQYAAKGGNQSQGYTYSGSNIPGDVAWYSANTSTLQNVKTKTPNELGVYDMSGNAAEFVETKNGSYPYYLGGSYKSSSDNIKCTSYIEHNSGSGSDYCKSSDIGFRLILTCE